jgi:hypothetical protein
VTVTQAPARAVPDPLAEPTITVARAAAILGVSVLAAHYAANRNEFPVLRVGRRVVVPTRRFLTAYGLDAFDSRAGPAVTREPTAAIANAPTPRPRGAAS